MKNTTEIELDSSNSIQALDLIVKSFYQAFDNRSDTPDLNSLTDYFLPSAVIINISDNGCETASVGEFLLTRQQLFEQKTIRHFHEFEISKNTSIQQVSAHRNSIYQKSGIIRGEKVEAIGQKSFHFALTENQWKICSIVWHDLTKSGARP